MMTIKEYYYTLFLVAVFINLFIFNKYHIFNNLIICEYIVVSLMIMLFFITSMVQMENYIILFVLVILITESILGLSLMVNLIRTHGNDFTKSITMTKF